MFGSIHQQISEDIMNCREFASAYAKKACASPSNIFGERFFDQHLSLVAHYAVMLAEKTGADRDVVETAAYLHDSFAIFHPERIPEHAAAGAEFVFGLLKENGYEDSFASRVAECVRTHSTPVLAGEGTIEQICLSNADAMTQIARPAYWLYYAYGVNKKGFADGSGWLNGWIDGSWARMIPQAREMVASEYSIAQSILSAVLVNG